jgi:hypothetical protein
VLNYFGHFHLTMWSSIAIILGFSFFVVFMDEYIMKPMRQKRWEKAAQSGDVKKQELLKLARSAKVVDE